MWGEGLLGGMIDPRPRCINKEVERMGVPKYWDLPDDETWLEKELRYAHDEVMSWSKWKREGMMREVMNIKSGYAVQKGKK